MNTFDDHHHLFTWSYKGSVAAFCLILLVFIINLDCFTQGQDYSCINSFPPKKWSHDTSFVELDIV